jgi:hypothetical protein
LVQKILLHAPSARWLSNYEWFTPASVTARDEVVTDKGEDCIKLSPTKDDRLSGYAADSSQFEPAMGIFAYEDIR